MDSFVASHPFCKKTMPRKRVSVGCTTAVARLSWDSPNTPQRFVLGASNVCLVGENPTRSALALENIHIGMRGSTVNRLWRCTYIPPRPPDPAPLPRLSISRTAGAESDRLREHGLPSSPARGGGAHPLPLFAGTVRSLYCISAAFVYTCTDFYPLLFCLTEVVTFCLFVCFVSLPLYCLRPSFFSLFLSPSYYYGGP